LAEPLWKIKKSLGRREFDISSQHTHSPRFFSRERASLVAETCLRSPLREIPYVYRPGCFMAG
jgi:hypothetical protein